MFTDQFRNGADVFIANLTSKQQAGQHSANAYADSQIKTRHTVRITHTGAAQSRTCADPGAGHGKHIGPKGDTAVRGCKFFRSLYIASCQNTDYKNGSNVNDRNNNACHFLPLFRSSPLLLQGLPLI